ncbi:MAG: hypothetical protein J0I47_09370 [Sphingomonas sp.]|uniref:hypothetical protein n=1 Tax=Sphingomonas sp. TaxID=28214 RepID=UPI001AD48633|nr:hypothetical protein [Sphingomonas sp.]MBN8808428.1 hypothetical protein [Sphingomonas sp.]
MIDPFTYWSRVLDSWRVMGSTGAMMARTLAASQDVIAVRTGMMRAAAHSPLDANYAELSRMVPEKVAAFSAAGDAVMAAWWKAQADGMAQMSKAMSGPFRAPSPFSVAEYWGDVALAMLRGAESGVRLGRDAIGPIHRTATANARRLGNRRGAS